MKLTRRQEEFIINLHELNRELDGPIHYSVLAERLGVSPITAYDMLCVLENKGVAMSEYQQRNSPGRAERYFYPCEADFVQKQRRSENADSHRFDDEGFRRFVLEQIRGVNSHGQGLARELLARFPEDKPYGAVRYCAELMTVIALRLQHSGGRQAFMNYLSRLLLTKENKNSANLAMLAGFGFGILAQESSYDAAWLNRLLDYIDQYNQIVGHMNSDQIHELSGYLVDLLKPLLTPGNQNSNLLFASTD